MAPFLVSLLLSPAAAPAAPAAAERSLAVFMLEDNTNLDRKILALLTDQVVQAIRSTGAFSRVSTPQDVALLMPPEQQRLLVKCATDNCAVVDNELAGALGVTHILVGGMASFGSSRLVSLRILEVRTGLVVATVSERVKSADPDALLDVLGPSAVKLVTDAGLAPARPSGSSNGGAVSGGGPGRLPWLLGAGGGWAVSGAALVLGVLTAGSAAAWLVGIRAVPAFASTVAALRPDTSDPAFMATFYGPPSTLAAVSLVLALAGLGLGAAGVALVGIAVTR